MAVTDWAVRSEHHTAEVYDFIDRSYNVFGDVWLDKVRITCRSGNQGVINTGIKSYDLAFGRAEYAGFRAYDTGQRHLLTNWVFEHCSAESGNVWVLPIGVNVPQAQVMVANVTYLSPVEPNAFFGWDVGSVDRFGSATYPPGYITSTTTI